MKQFFHFSASVTRVKPRGIRGLWLATARRFHGTSPDSAALHPGYAGSALFALVVDQCESAWRSGLPLSQRGNEGDLATFAWVTVSEIPPNPTLKKGGIRASTSSTANADRAGYTDFHSGIHATSPLASRQAGAALITSLIFLTVLTILGMSTLGTALLESRMSGNMRDRNMAFQAAEIGLRDAELYIRDSGRIVGLNEEGYDTGAICVPTDKECDAQVCKLGLCYNGGTMAASGAANAWYLNNKAVWLDGETYWVNALQYAHDDSEDGEAGPKIVGIGNEAEIDVLNAATGNCAQIPGSCHYSQPVRLPLVRRQPEYLIEAFQKDVGGSRFYYRITVRGYGMRSGTRVMLQEVYTP